MTTDLVVAATAAEKSSRSVQRAVPRTPDPDAKFWRIASVVAYTQRSKSAIYADKGFPRPVRFGPKSVAWEADAVRSWAADRIAAARVSE